MPKSTNNLYGGGNPIIVSTMYASNALINSRDNTQAFVVYDQDITSPLLKVDTSANLVTMYADLNVVGSATFISVTNINVTSSMISLANSNTTDLLDIGFYGKYNTTKYTGLIRKASDGIYRLFKEVSTAPGTTVTLDDTNNADIRLANIYSTGILQVSSGTVSAPSLSFLNSTTSGAYLIGANNIGISTNSTKRIDISDSTVLITNALSITGTTTSYGIAPASNATYDIGLTGTRYRYGYYGKMVIGYSAAENSSNENALTIGSAASSGQTTSRMYFTAPDSTNLTIGKYTSSTQSGIAFITNEANTDMTFGTNNTEVVRITAGGSVGIGTSSTVSAKLHSISTTEPLRLGYDATNYAKIVVSSTGNTTLSTLTSASGGDIVFSAAGTTMLTISSTQFSATPSTALTSGNGFFILSPTFYTAGAGATWYNLRLGAAFSAGAASTEYTSLYITPQYQGSYTITDAYCVRIATTKNTGNTITNAIGVSVAQNMGGGAVTNYFGIRVADVIGTASVSTYTGLSITVPSAATTKYSIITSGGTVGINTLTPTTTYALHVAGTTLLAGNTDFSANNTYNIGSSSSTAAYIYTKKMLIGTTTEITSGTNVLTVGNDGGTTARMYFRDPSGGLMTFGKHQLGTANGDAFFWNEANTDMVYGTNNTEVMRYKSAGTVGLGANGFSTTISAKFHVFSTTEQLRLSYDTAGTYYSSFTTSSAGNLTITPSGGSLTVGANILSNSTNTRDIGSSANVYANIYSTNAYSTYREATDTSSSSRAKTKKYVSYATTTDAATATEMKFNGASFTISSNKAWFVEARVMCIHSGSTAARSLVLRGLVLCDNSSTVTTYTESLIASNVVGTSTATLALTNSTTTIKFNVNGVAATTIYYCGQIEITEISAT